MVTAADGHGVDEAGFGFGGGLEVSFEVGAEGHEAVTGFDGDDDGVG